MAEKTLIWLTLMGSVATSLSYEVGNIHPVEVNGFCIDMFMHRTMPLSKLENCVVVIGDLIIAPRLTLKNITFPKLKEVTGFMVVYHLNGMESLGHWFPNLARIRGNTLFYNYALIVSDMSNLREVGLYNLIKIDRGGVIIWGNPMTCFVDTIDWDAIAPGGRRVLSTPDRKAGCNFRCRCSTVPAWNRCWNNMKCQRLLDGPEGENCSSECIGCRKSYPGSCTLCRNYSFRGECVPRCPNDTYILSASNHCITKQECSQLNRWISNDQCVPKCVQENDKVQKYNDSISCAPCKDCNTSKICRNLHIHDLPALLLAENCVYVKGYLKIHIWSVSQLKVVHHSLKNIEEVSNYILIENSVGITSLHFLSSLKRIKGEQLYNGSYSVVIHDMQNLQRLFLPNVTENLKIDNGSLRVYRNRMLCASEIEKLNSAFPLKADIPLEFNGYGTACDEVYPSVRIEVKNETFAIAIVKSLPKQNFTFILLYVKVPNDSFESTMPESCSNSEWSAVNIPNTGNTTITVELTSLKPASNYAVCIEKYDHTSQNIARSNVTNFMTAVGKPEPPFILELAASTFDVIVIRWVNHLDYLSYITKYELDVILVDIYDSDITVRDHCVLMDDDLFEIDYSRHAKVMRPPNNYEKGCESKCGILSSVTYGAMVDDFFDVCSAINCSENEIERPKNSSVHNVMKSLALDLDTPRNNSYQVGGLLPFRDYRFHLRACVKDKCSTSAIGVVRTLRLDTADIASVIHASADTSGFIDVKWDPPKRTNGPLLSYTLEIYSDVQITNNNHLSPQAWCVFSNVTSLKVKTNIADKYLVRICTMTLGSSYSCNDWTKVVALKNYESVWWWSGILVGAFLPMLSCILCWRVTRKLRDIESIPLVDLTSRLSQQSEAPATMFSDFVPSNYILASDLQFE